MRFEDGYNENCSSNSFIIATSVEIQHYILFFARRREFNQEFFITILKQSNSAIFHDIKNTVI